ncbi:KPN_02809 family neutral zinc metallopeptidase [Inhella inkyongensis]|nr:neutral zinc metallopeptidase [Inhella inkyongensis]
MKWEGHRESDRVEDLRGRPSGAGRRGLGLGGIVLALVAAWLFGINPMTVLSALDDGSGAPVQVDPGSAGDDPARDPATRFVRVVLADTEDVWQTLFKQRQQPYTPPRLRLFRGQTETACGTGDSAMGPFYCPGDQHIYLDLDFFDTLSKQLGAPGEFAAAYVVAHEVAHHLQQQLGISAKVQQARSRLSEVAGNQLSVRLELQADCLAGVWTHHSQKGKQWLERSDVEAALNAASRIGDDVLQKAANGQVVPESFTHGSAAQRQRWFSVGMQQGRIEACDTFAAAQP